MWRARALWLAVAVAAWGHTARETWAQGPPLPPDFLTLLASLRPAKTVVRAVKAAAPEFFLGLEERVRGWGYPFETHSVYTEDGYILIVHRIPRGRMAAGDEANDLGNSQPRARPPVIMQHGFICSSEQWVIGGPGMAPALRLADEGYDVWLTNIRGNHFSNKHETLGRRDPRFWKFSWHEMGMYDVPAFIDYILNATKQEKLFFVDHSSGGSMFYVTMSMRPDYNAKVRLHVSLAPGVFLEGMSSVPLQTINNNTYYITELFDAMPTYQLLGRTDSLTSMIFLFCNGKSYFSKLCAVVVSWIVGAVDLREDTVSSGNLTMVTKRI